MNVGKGALGLIHVTSAAAKALNTAKSRKRAAAVTRPPVRGGISMARDAFVGVKLYRVKKILHTL